MEYLWYRQQPLLHGEIEEDYSHCAGELSAVNTIGTQLRNPIYSRLAQ